MGDRKRQVRRAANSKRTCAWSTASLFAPLLMTSKLVAMPSWAWRMGDKSAHGLPLNLTRGRQD